MFRSIVSVVRSSSRGLSLSSRAFAEEGAQSSSTPPTRPPKRDVDDLFKDEKPQRRHAYSVNRVEILGGVVDTPIVRVAKNGSEYAIFNVITNVRDMTERHSITAFGKTAQFVRDNVNKGNRVMVNGRLHYSGGQLQDDGTRTPRQTHIQAETIQPLAKRAAESH